MYSLRPKGGKMSIDLFQSEKKCLKTKKEYKTASIHILPFIQWELNLRWPQPTAELDSIKIRSREKDEE